MYFLDKICSVCVRTGVHLLDMDTADFDSVKFSEKFEICTKMVVNRESFTSTQICRQCIKKLRISYDFQKMVHRSSKILQGYLAELMTANSSADKTSAGPDNGTFVNSELRVTVVPLKPRPHRLQHKPVFRRKRITKEERCSLLKKLLMSTKRSLHKRNRHSNHNNSNNNRVQKKKHQRFVYKGGLKNIISFTKNYDFGYELEAKQQTSGSGGSALSPLGELANFTNRFFLNDFAEFKNTILYIIENKDSYLCDEDETEEDDDDELMFNVPPDIVDSDSDLVRVKVEELVVEPDVRIKTEIDYDEYDPYSANYYVEASYSNNYNNVECKKENVYEDDNLTYDSQNNLHSYQENGAEVPQPVNYFHHHHEQSPQQQQQQQQQQQPQPQSSSIQMLDQLIDNLRQRPYSHHSFKCRTKHNPYINPDLRQQFQLRSFQCDKCNRYFKSPGYLKAHISKLHHHQT